VFRRKVLIVAAAAAPKIRARRIDSLRRDLEDPQRPGVNHSLGGADLLHFRAFARQDPRNQNRAARVVA